jgi:hypothetical protein
MFSYCSVSVEKDPQYPLYRRLVGPGLFAGMEAMEERRILTFTSKL